MTNDKKNKIIGFTIIFAGMILFGYIIFSKHKSIILSGIAGLLFGMGIKTLRLNKKNDKKNSKSDQA